MFRPTKFAVGFECSHNLRVEQCNSLISRLLRSFPTLLSHLCCCNLPKIDWIVRIIRARPDGQVLHNLLETFLRFLITLLRHVAIPDVAVSEEEKLVFGDVEGRFFSERNHFGLVALDNFRRTGSFPLELSYCFVRIVE